LKKHSHAERAELLERVIVPMLQKELGRNLIAIATDGSFARRDDRSYSDLEFMVFVKSNKDLPVGFSKIYDGMLVEGIFVTEAQYHKMVHEPNKDWYIAGSDRLMAITNPRFIEKVAAYRTRNLPQKCDRFAVDMLNEIQEAFGKLFNAIEAKNIENLYPILLDAVMGTLKLMALINRKSYKSLNSMISEARTFMKKPEGFDEFMTLLKGGKYNDLKKLHRSSKILFVGIEELLRSKYGDDFYDSDLSTIKQKTKAKIRR